MTTEELKALAEKYFDETIVYWTGQKSRPNDLPAGFGKLMDLVKEVQRRTREENSHLIECAWGVIANAGEGSWDRESKQWQAAAAAWRDSYHAFLAEEDSER